jgi:hypothetical protein
MKLYKAMFDTSVLKQIFGTMLKVVLIVSGYVLLLFYVVSTQTFTGGQNIGEIVFTLVLVYFSFYGAFIFLPFYLFLKYTYESEVYLTPLALAYGVTLSTSKKPILEKKERRKIAFYLFISALFLFIITILYIDEAPFAIILGLIPFYIMMYINWINGLTFALGESFTHYYKLHKQQYFLRASGFIFLMHIPLFWFFQPWILQALAESYFKSMKMNDNIVD